MVSDCPVEAGAEAVAGEVVRLLEGPVPAGEGARQHELAQQPITGQYRGCGPMRGEYSPGPAPP